MQLLSGEKRKVSREGEDKAVRDPQEENQP